MENESKKNPELDLAPLSLAHEHARCASVATKTNNVPLARDQHVLAAGEFAKAAESAASLEALRTLKLLEDHHKHMSELIKDLPNPNTRPKKTGDEGLEVIAEKDANEPSAAVAKLSDERKSSDKSLDPAQSSSTRRSPAKPTSQPRRPPSRELSSSIASNLASARGIKANHPRLPVSPSISTQHAPGSFEQPVRRDRQGNRIPFAPTPQPGKPSWVPPISGNDASQPGSNPYGKKREKTTEEVAPKAKTTADLGFEKFYKMTEGFMNKISAPLAYAGLPLNAQAEDTPAKPETENGKSEPNRKRSDTRTSQTSAANEPDLTQFISKAALRAVGGGGNISYDSFYVVPSTGMTISYANIISYDEKQKRRETEPAGNEDGEDEEDDDFVDAKETFSERTSSGRVSAQTSLTNNMRKRFSRASTSRQQDPSSGVKAGNEAVTVTGNVGGKGRSKSENIVMEELEIKNQELRRVVDALTKRLHVFESSAQRSSLALHESIRFIGAANSPVASVLSGNGPAEGVSRTSSPARERGDRTVVEDVVDAIRLKEMEGRIRELEGEREGLGREVQRERKEAERLRETVRKYREKWEVLKKGAKERRSGVGSGASSEASAGGKSEEVGVRNTKAVRELAQERKAGVEGKDKGDVGDAGSNTGTGSRDRERNTVEVPGRYLAG